MASEPTKHPSEFTVRIRNFASFADSEEFTLKTGLNTFIGVNNAGKTALLCALAGLSQSARKQQNVHPTLTDILKRYSRSETDPIVEIRFPIRDNRAEIMGTLCTLASNREYPDGANADSLEFMWVFTQETVALASMKSRVSASSKTLETNLLELSFQDNNPAVVFINEHPYRYKRPNSYSPPKFEVTILPSRTDFKVFRFENTPNPLSSLWPDIFERVVLLSTHRNPPSRAQHYCVTSLDFTASNLPQVLATVQMSSPGLPNGRELFSEIEDHLRKLFPEIRRVRTEIIPTENRGSALEVEIKLDLKNGTTVPLSHSGTGVQQMLALLTGAIVNEKRSLFLLDEPHSYLHPAAERGLINIMENLSKLRGHVFCISTHSPILASHSRKQLFSVRSDGTKGSKVRSLGEAAEILDAIGITNPDLFTYSKVIFVEGPSDEKVIHAVSKRLNYDPLTYRVKFQQLGGGGLLKSHSRSEFIELLHKANVAEVQVPINFILDSSDWSHAERLKLSELNSPDGQPVVHFLKLPEIENYLLHPDAIAYALNKRLVARKMQVNSPSSAEINKILKEKIDQKGSDLIQTVFKICACDYSKNRDVVPLLEFILENDPTHLDKLGDELSKLLVGNNCS